MAILLPEFISLSCRMNWIREKDAKKKREENKTKIKSIMEEEIQSRTINALIEELKKTGSPSRWKNQFRCTDGRNNNFLSWYAIKSILKIPLFFTRSCQCQIIPRWGLGQIICIYLLQEGSK